MNIFNSKTIQTKTLAPKLILLNRMITNIPVVTVTVAPLVQEVFYFRNSFYLSIWIKVIVNFVAYLLERIAKQELIEIIFLSKNQHKKL